MELPRAARILPQRRIAMPDSKSSKPGARNYAGIVPGKCHELNYFSLENHLKADAEKIIKEARRNRERANEMAITLFLSINARNAAVCGLEAARPALA
jgi:hypothetical protein